MNVLVFRLLQYAVLGILVIYISDFRKKKDMVPLVGERWTLLLKLAYLVPLAMYGHTLVAMRTVTVFDLLALGLTLAGTFIVIRAKRDLSNHHTWAGYCLGSASLTTTGIYAYIRHPLYAGIYLVILGSLFTIIPRLNLPSHLTLPAAALFSVSYVIWFLALSAHRETKAMLRRYGASFRCYMDVVHPFLPLRKYRGNDE